MLKMEDNVNIEKTKFYRMHRLAGLIIITPLHFLNVRFSYFIGWLEDFFLDTSGLKFI